MAASQELLINAFVATSAIAGGQLGGNDESVVVFFLLTRCGLVAFQAVHTLAGVSAHFIFMHHGILDSGMALSALARGAD